MNISRMILKKRGHCPFIFDRTFKLIKRNTCRIGKKSTNKLFSGKIPLDMRTNIHKHVLELFETADPPFNIKNPLVVGGTKLKSYIFTKKKFYKKMRSIWLSKNLL